MLCPTVPTYLYNIAWPATSSLRFASLPSGSDKAKEIHSDIVFFFTAAAFSLQLDPISGPVPTERCPPCP